MGHRLSKIMTRTGDTGTTGLATGDRLSKAHPRVTAMGAATRNAGEMIDQLTLYMNKARQATITRELIEVVSGAEAL